MDSEERAKICITIDAEGDAAENPRTTSLGIEAVTPVLLDAFSRAGVRATFFVQEDLICRIGSRYRGMWKSIRDEGHEIALHSHGLIQASDQERERIAEAGIRGLREAGFNPVSFRAGRYFASGPFLEVLARHGIRFDSSVVPGLRETGKDGRVRCDHTGAPEGTYIASFTDHRRESGSGILEIPINRYPRLDPSRLGILTGRGPLEEVLFDYFLDVRKDQVIVVNIHPWDGLAVLWNRLVRAEGYGSLRKVIYRGLGGILGPGALLNKGYGNRLAGFLDSVRNRDGVRFATIAEVGEGLITKEDRTHGR